MCHINVCNISAIKQPIYLEITIFRLEARPGCQVMDAEAAAAQNKAEALVGKCQVTTPTTRADKLIFIFVVFSQLPLNQFAGLLPSLHLLCVCWADWFEK